VRKQEKEEVVFNKKFLIAWIVLFVVWMVGSFVVHGILLGADYKQLAGLFRPETEAGKYFPLMIFAHVLLSAHVFVAAHRALAIALAASEVVCVRSSRREPVMPELLLEGAPGLFRVQAELEPEAGDSLWAYGSDETLLEVARSLKPGVRLHAHGSGFGIGVIAGRPSAADLEKILPRLAEDIALFDQRGCLSPRLLFVSGAPELAAEVAQELAAELTRLESRIPRGRLDSTEAAEITAYRDTARYAGEVFAAGLGFVSTGTQFVLPPAGRNLHVLATRGEIAGPTELSSWVTCCAFHGDPVLRARLESAWPGARFSEFGHMQRPPFDGPVDRRRREREP